MAQQFKTGDQVQLKSGGPVMTVTGRSGVTEDSVYAKWFAGSKLETGTFPDAALQTPVPKEAKAK